MDERSPDKVNWLKVAELDDLGEFPFVVGEQDLFAEIGQAGGRRRGGRIVLRAGAKAEAQTPQPASTRFRIIRALEMLWTKRDSNPPRKHGNIPL